MVLKKCDDWPMLSAVIGNIPIVSKRGMAPVQYFQDIVFI
jgi:hypothetical protein